MVALRLQVRGRGSAGAQRAPRYDVQLRVPRLRLFSVALAEASDGSVSEPSVPWSLVVDQWPLDKLANLMITATALSTELAIRRMLQS